MPLHSFKELVRPGRGVEEVHGCMRLFVPGGPFVPVKLLEKAPVEAPMKIRFLQTRRNTFPP